MVRFVIRARSRSRRPHVTETSARNRRRAAWLALPVSAALLFACGGSDDESTDTGATDTTEAADPGGDTTAPDAGSGEVGDGKITVKGFAFDPNETTVKVGTTVTWTNDDGASHTATADDGAFDTKSMQKGDTGEATLDEAGTFAYHCDIHPTMTGTITVVE